jgi:hypothetical protein
MPSIQLDCENCFILKNGLLKSRVLSSGRFLMSLMKQPQQNFYFQIKHDL